MLGRSAARAGARGARLARRRPRRLGREAEALAAAIPARGWSPALGAFARAFGSDAPDASTLPLCFSGLLPLDDPRLAATVDVVRRELGHGDLVRHPRDGDFRGNFPQAFTHLALSQAAADLAGRG